MSRLVPPVARSVAIAVALLLAVALPGSVDAARSRTTSSTTGFDISWPQCGGAFPAGQAFGIVGVNDGLANNLNPCLGTYKGGAPSTSELYWALRSSGKSSPGHLLPAELYVNTADPGPGVADWPTSTTSNGVTVSCIGQDTSACAWQYGWNRAAQDMAWLTQAATDVQAATSMTIPTSPSAYPWWLDVETGNSWETGSSGLANNVADLQGMVAAFEANGAAVGIYSTSYQWGQITGGSMAGNLAGLPDWIPGARRLSGAQANCSLPSFTGGTVTVTQWFGSPYDGDYAC